MNYSVFAGNIGQDPDDNPHGVDHDFERAVEGMDDDTVRAMYYIMRGNRDTLYEALKRATSELRAIQRVDPGVTSADRLIADCEAALKQAREVEND